MQLSSVHRRGRPRENPSKNRTARFSGRIRASFGGSVRPRTMKDDVLEYGAPATEDEAHAFAEVMMQGLGTTPPLDHSWIEGWLQRTRAAGELRIVRRRGAVAGGGAILGAGQWFGGRSVASGAISVVAIAPEHRGRGAA